ncbi:DEAD/DEAH box helicase [Candidatus Phytoplasma citri]|uniref:DEAD/DEAH box helicase n=1 Tax=Candidatus Phytoplasma citri TaxID=180978 RepID=A0A1S9M3I8_9MOLU|nr:DEAD/DEAH box helicase [Candidatus Phytoplasma aurantifolia]MDO8060232.1 DEAD/DEAH box helicase [Candidatus Phytoplasma aurantifolia]MDO8078954.1 DEAD/DEAH box helicase [Candidatus Phytoplasma aurantifolia]OOP59673.1 DNA helicase [Candidatus Phytoplasma aurantifolia]
MISSFKELNLLTQIQEALKELNFINPTPVQALVIPKMIQGIDIVARSQTGTGKTFAFGIPMIQKIDSQTSQIQALVLCPTRELALQVFTEINKLLKFYSEIRTAVIYGGEKYFKQFSALNKKPHIIVATPGRILDLLKQQKIDLSHVKLLVLDEADEMLKMGFQEDVEDILKNIPSERQTALFSATMPDFIKKIAEKYQKNSQTLEISNKNIAVKSIKQFYFIVSDINKNLVLERLLDYQNPDSVIIFANTKKNVDNITDYLQTRNFLVDALHGDLKQNQRQYVLNNFRNKKIKILVATDVAARGLDISDIQMVINYDLSNDYESYVHRIGRTGRAGKSGVSYSFINVRQKMKLKKLEYYLKEKLLLAEIPKIEEIYQQQDQLFRDKVFQLIENYKNNNLSIDMNLMDKLLQKYDQELIIKSLINYISPCRKQYENIIIRNVSNYNNDEFAKTSYNKNNRINSDYFKKYEQNNINMTKLIINIGKNDRVYNPATFLQILYDKFNIYRKNIGYIQHFADKTVFEINNNFVNKLKTKKDIYWENKLIIISDDLGNYSNVNNKYKN